MFKDDSTQTQWQRSRSLKMGLEKVSEVFTSRFEIDARGVVRCYWAESRDDLNDVYPPSPEGS